MVLCGSIKCAESTEFCVNLFRNFGKLIVLFGCVIRVQNVETVENFVGYLFMEHCYSEIWLQNRVLLFAVLGYEKTHQAHLKNTKLRIGVFVLENLFQKAVSTEQPKGCNVFGSAHQGSRKEN